MKFTLGITIGTAALALLLPSISRAATVECSDEYGSCELSNDGPDSISCSCDEGDSGGTTGGDEWEGLSEEELLEICEVELAFCEVGATDSSTTSVGTDTDYGTGTDA